MQVESVIKEYAIKNNRSETLLFNNRLWHGSLPRTKEKDDQYKINRRWILDHFKK